MANKATIKNRQNLAKAFKSRASKKRTYAKGGRIPKYSNGGLGGSGVTPLSAYQIDLDQNQRGSYNNMYNNQAADYGGYGSYGYDQYNAPQMADYGNAIGGDSAFNTVTAGARGNSSMANFNDTQYGDYNASGAMSAAGVVGSVGSGMIDANLDQNQLGYEGIDPGASWSQSAVGSTGAWGAAISGVSQLGVSALDSGVKVSDEGTVENESYDKFASSLETGLLDPAQNLDVVFSDDYTGAERIGSLLMPGLAGIYQADKEQEDAENAAAERRKLEGRKRRAMREQTPKVDYQPTLMYPNGGKVGGIVGYDAYGKPIYSQTPAGLNTASYTPNELRPRTVIDTRNTAVDTLGIDPNEFKTGYRNNPQAYTDSIANVYPNRYKSEQNSLGNWTLSEYIANPNKTTEFAKGGQTGRPSIELNNGNANAELETKEVFRTPDGSIEKVPEGTPSHKNGGVKMTLPEGTEILGKMKGKYMDKSYKEYGQDLYKKYNKYNKIIKDSTSALTRRTAEKMLEKVQKSFDTLMDDQEFKKNYDSYSQSIKSDFEGNLVAPDVDASDYRDPQYAKGGKIPQYPDGIYSIPTDGTRNDMQMWRQMQQDEQLMRAYAEANASGAYKGNYNAGIYNTDLGINTQNPQAIQQYLQGWKGPGYQPNLQAAATGSDPKPYFTVGDLADFSQSDLYANMRGPDETFVDPYTDSLINKYNQSVGNTPTTARMQQPTAATQPVVRDNTNLQKLQPRNVAGNMNTANALENAQLADMSGSIARNDARTQSTETEDPSKFKKWYQENVKGNYGQIGLGATQFAPAAYNLYQGLFGDKRTLDANDYRNPYRNRIMQSLNDRKYNIKPELEANELAYQTARRNMRQVAPSTGNLLTNYTALAGSRMRADAGAYSRKQNMENQWRGQDAGILSQMGARESATKLGVDQYNESVEAARQGAVSTGIDQLAGAAFNIGANKNTRYNDELVGKAYQAYASKYNLDTNDINSFMQFLNTTK